LLGAGAFILTALALAALGLTFLFQDHVEGWVDGELDGYLDQVIAGIDIGPDGKLAVTEPPANPRFTQPLSGRYWQVVVEPDGPLLRSRSLWDFEIPLLPAGTVDDEAHHGRVPGPDGTHLYLLQRLAHSRCLGPGARRTETPVGHAEQTRRHRQRQAIAPRWRLS
jgi:hypothetical protein